MDQSFYITESKNGATRSAIVKTDDMRYLSTATLGEMGGEPMPIGTEIIVAFPAHAVKRGYPTEITIKREA